MTEQGQSKNVLPNLRVWTWAIMIGDTRCGHHVACLTDDTLYFKENLLRQVHAERLAYALRDGKPPESVFPKGTHVVELGKITEIRRSEQPRLLEIHSSNRKRPLVIARTDSPIVFELFQCLRDRLAPGLQPVAGFVSWQTSLISPLLFAVIYLVAASILFGLVVGKPDSPIAKNLSAWGVAGILGAIFALYVAWIALRVWRPHKAEVIAFDNPHKQSPASLSPVPQPAIKLPQQETSALEAWSWKVGHESEQFGVACCTETTLYVCQERFESKDKAVIVDQLGEGMSPASVLTEKSVAIPLNTIKQLRCGERAAILEIDAAEHGVVSMKCPVGAEHHQVFKYLIQRLNCAATPRRGFLTCKRSQLIPLSCIVAALGSGVAVIAWWLMTNPTPERLPDRARILNMIAAMVATIGVWGVGAISLGLAAICVAWMLYRHTHPHRAIVVEVENDSESHFL